MNQRVKCKQVRMKEISFILPILPFLTTMNELAFSLNGVMHLLLRVSCYFGFDGLILLFDA